MTFCVSLNYKHKFILFRAKKIIIIDCYQFESSLASLSNVCNRLEEGEKVKSDRIMRHSIFILRKQSPLHNVKRLHERGIKHLEIDSNIVADIFEFRV